MSQALTLRVLALEARVAELEQANTEPLESSFGGYVSLHTFEPFHKGHGRFGVRSDDGTEVGTEHLTKEDAEAIAKDLNEQTEVMSA